MIRRNGTRGAGGGIRAGLAAALMIASAVTASAPAVQAAAQDPTVTVEDLEREPELRERLAEIDTESERAIADRTSAEAALQTAQRRQDALADDLTDIDLAIRETVEREASPVAVRRELAVLVYMRGEPSTNEIVRALRTGTFEVENQNAKIAADEVFSDIFDELDRLERQKRSLRDDRADLVEARSAVESTIVERTSDIARLGESIESLETEHDELADTLEQMDLLRIRLAAEERARAEAAEAAAAAAASEASAQAADLATATGPDPDPSNDEETTNRVDATTTTLPAGSPTHPRTGGRTLEPVGRPALAVKIDNSPRARPQSGINDADIVFEEVVEAGLTRFVAVFHSTTSDPVGPIRSARTSDLHILANLNTPLFANSGANRATLAAIARSDLADVGINAAAAAYRRLGGRPAPHNLYSSTASLWRAAPSGAGLPPNYFRHRGPGETLTNAATPAQGVSIDFGNETVRYQWNGDGWARSIGGAASNDAAGTRVAPENVVVLFIPYGQSPADARSPEAIVAGSGVAWVLTDGKVVVGSWSRPADDAPTELIDRSGEPITLSPGRTWVALAPIGSGTLRS